MAAPTGGVTGFGIEEAEADLAHNRDSSIIGNEQQVCLHYCPLNVPLGSRGIKKNKKKKTLIIFKWSPEDPWVWSQMTLTSD